jgi:hypothetical protein
MPTPSTAGWLLAQEVKALLTRLAMVRPFALHETMLPAAAPAPAAHLAIEGFLLDGRRELRMQALEYLQWLTGPGRDAPPAEQQRRFALVRLRFLGVLSQFDLFQEAITQRSEHQVGLWLSGLDVAAADALSLPGGYLEPPPVLCYLDRGPGAAIRRARARIPGGGRSPVALVRIPRERMVGHGIASSLVHEVGHQAAALLGLVESLRPALGRVEAGAPPPERPAWQLWARWVSEVVADFWSVGKLGIASTLGLLGVVSLPRPFVFRISVDDPHPFPWIRVQLSCAIGDALYPHGQWRDLARLWSSLYPVTGLDRERRGLLAILGATLPSFVALLVGHRPRSLRGRSLEEVMPRAGRSPAALADHYRDWASRPELLRQASPTLAFAVVGQARAAGQLDPGDESRILTDLLTHWALASTLEALGHGAAPAVAAPAAAPQPAPIPALR